MKKKVGAMLAIILTVALSVNAFAFTPPAHNVPANGNELVVLAQYYDAGGEGVAYHAIPSQWAGAAQGPNPLRPDDSGNGIGPVLNLDAAGNIEAIGYTAEGMWINYTVNFPRTGTYAVTAMIAVPENHTAGITIAGNTVERAVNTGGWEAFEVVDFGTFEVTAGAHVVKYDFLVYGANVQSISIRLLGGGGTARRNPLTGDGFNPAWLAVSGVGLAASLAVMGVVLVKRKKA
jgi:LPXTG-motif cell wall-anchored protein